jgi:hypothetical protein
MTTQHLQRPKRKQNVEELYNRLMRVLRTAASYHDKDIFIDNHSPKPYGGGAERARDSHVKHSRVWA